MRRAFSFRIWLCLLLCAGFSQAQAQSSERVYQTHLVKDGFLTAGGISMSVVGSLLIKDKPALTEADLLGLNASQVNAFDRFAAGNYSKKAQKASDVFFYTSFGLPLAFLADEKGRSQATDIFFLYAETISLTGGLYALTAGLIDRKRPNVYATHAPLEERLHKYATNSFFAGHTASTASISFFMAKVFHDLHPDSPWRPVVWGAGAAVPATVGYLRMRAGKHFLSDNILGYTIGASIGILVPELHKRNRDTSWRLVPTTEFVAGTAWQGLGMTRRF